MERIIVDPQLHFDKPVAKGMRITMQNVLELVNEGLSFDQIMQDDHPDLKKKMTSMPACSMLWH